MSFGRKRSNGRISLAMLGCGMAALLPLAGCGSGSSSTASTSTASTAPGSPSTVRGTNGSTSASTSGAQPSWASALGPGVTVVPPQSVPAGHGSPGAAVTGMMTTLTAKQSSAFCSYGLPVNQAKCESVFIKTPPADLPYETDYATGYVAIDGTKALVGMTGKFCTPGQSPECTTKSDPAAVFSAGHSFSALWSVAVKENTLVSCVEIGGKWYIFSS